MLLNDGYYYHEELKGIVGFLVQSKRVIQGPKINQNNYGKQAREYNLLPPNH